MASNKGFSLPHPYYTILIGALLLIGLAFLVRSVLLPTVFEQHASIDQFNAIAVKGSVYVDSNRNGKKDAGEVNYTGTPQGQVWLALFTNKCGEPTPSVRPSATPIPPTGAVTPTPPSGCYYQKLCPMGILCRGGDRPWCPPCKAQLVCPSGPAGGPIPPSGSGGTVTVTATPIKGGAVQGVSDLAQAQNPSQEDQDKKDAQNDDVCRRLPTRVIHCPVAADGTYTCTAEGVTFTDAWVKASEPARYIITSANPVKVIPPAATVDFGIYRFFQPMPPTQSAPAGVGTGQLGR